MEHPLGGPDIKAMAAAIERLQDEVATLIIELGYLKESVSSMVMMQSPNFGGYRPKNWGENG